ncbi:hypothetical protein [Acidocella sp.]|uniref:hypothetical protein n=2 Tax=Acidocella sp. TaxID=50710 RepID=UPI00260A5CC6|nr:hypothetical protein [Acidocella sp.]
MMVRFVASMLFLGAVAALTGCAIPVAAPPPEATRPVMSYDAPVAVLRQQMAREVPAEISPSPGDDGGWIAHTRAVLAASPYRISVPQLVVAVDRNPAVQQMRVIFADPAGPWQVIGGGKVSTGRAGRRGFFITPVGVFAHTTAILDYRAEGTYNSNHIRGLGEKGRRVWDFGWQSAVAGWRMGGVTGTIRLLMHATDPDVLAPRLGRPDSQGCVRISAAMNVFLDRHAVLDADYLGHKATSRAVAAVLPANADPFPYAGTYLVVFDSSASAP